MFGRGTAQLVQAHAVPLGGTGRVSSRSDAARRVCGGRGSLALPETGALRAGFLSSLLRVTCVRTAEQHTPLPKPRSRPGRGALAGVRTERSSCGWRCPRVEGDVLMWMEMSSCGRRCPWETCLNPRPSRLLRSGLGSDAAAAQRLPSCSSPGLLPPVPPAWDVTIGAEAGFAPFWVAQGRAGGSAARRGSAAREALRPGCSSQR